MANRLLNVLKTERMKNKAILYSILGLLMLAIVYIVYSFIF
jgi:hypothetical protein